MNEIKNAIIKANINAPGGNLELDNLQYSIRTVAALQSPADLENIIVSTKNNTPVFLKDIASVEDSYAKATSYFGMYKEGISQEKTVTPAISLTVTRNDSTDTIKPSNEIKELLENGKGKLYPEDVLITISNDMAVKVDEQLADVTGNAISGLLIIIIVLFLFIGFQESLIVSFVIPISLLCTFMLLQYSGMTLNRISLLALIIALGMLVDNAIVVMENINRIRGQGLDIKSASKFATNQVAQAVAASTLTTMAAFFPMALMSGIRGDFMKVIPITVMFAVGASLIISLIITPALCSRFLRTHKVKNKEKNPKLVLIQNILSVLLVFCLSLYAFSNGSFGLLSWSSAVLFSGAMYLKKFKYNNSPLNGSSFIKLYEGFMAGILRDKKRKLSILAVTLLIFIISLSVIPLGLLKIALVPTVDNPNISIVVETPTGYLLDDSGTVVKEIENVLFTYPEIDNFISKVGIEGANSAQLSVVLVPYEERARASMEIVDQLRADVKNIAGARITVNQGSRGLSGDIPISIELKGDNLEELAETAEDFKNILNSIPGVVEPSTSLGEGAPEIQVVVDRQRASLLGIDPTTIGTEIRNAVQGIKVSTLRENQKEVDIVIRTSAERFNTLRDLEKVYFTSSAGEKIAFTQVASLVETRGFSAIEHQDLQRIIKVEADLTKGITVNEVLSTFKSKISDYSVPGDVTISYGGESEATAEVFGELAVKMIVAVILVFIILVIEFNSLSQPLTILFTVPLAVIGVMFGLIITHNNFGMYAFMGVVSLVGIAVNNAIVLVDFTNDLRKKGYDMLDALTEAGKIRFLPVFITSMTTIGAILPLALKDLTYGEMGFTLIFGLMTSTVLTLVIIPILYSLVEEYKLQFQKKYPF
ncbi:hypothetical protein N752_27030 [Desulforamulus aquiferis]|nr:hypothetical protein N752_27030 [Desulforamulus aquiferis]